jgi:hypothetical protein
MISGILKKYHLILSITLILFLPINIFSQYRLGNHLGDNSIITLSSAKGVLYSGIDNFIKVNPDLISDYDTIYIESNNGKVASDSNDLVLIIPNRPGKVRLTLSGIKFNDTTEIGYKYFTVYGIPQPMLTINNIPVNTPCTIPRKAMIECDSLGIFFSNDIAGSENWLKISKFVLGYNYGGFYISHINQGNILSNETKNILNTIGPDREISIRLTTISEGMVFKELPIYRITVY